MTLLTCPECRGQVSDAAPACPRCGAPADRIRTLLRDKNAAQTRSSIVLVGVVLSLILLLGLCSAVNSWRSDRAQRETAAAAEVARQKATEIAAAQKRNA